MTPLLYIRTVLSSSKLSRVFNYFEELLIFKNSPWCSSLIPFFFFFPYYMELIAKPLCKFVKDSASLEVPGPGTIIPCDGSSWMCNLRLWTCQGVQPPALYPPVPVTLAGIVQRPSSGPYRFHQRGRGCTSRQLVGRLRLQARGRRFSTSTSADLQRLYSSASIVPPACA
jgi:hypothetical protein